MIAKIKRTEPAKFRVALTSPITTVECNNKSPEMTKQKFVEADVKMKQNELLILQGRNKTRRERWGPSASKYRKT